MACRGDKLISFSVPKDLQEAMAIQLALREKLIISPLKKRIKTVCALDAAFIGNNVVAAACLFRFPALSLLKETALVEEVHFPYVPGYLTFREGPAVLHALSRLQADPDLILIDGQGIAHPKGFGIASHLGVILDMPTIGCAKSRLVGEYEEPGRCRGESSPLIYNGNIVGAVLRTRNDVAPLFISPGHCADIPTSIDIVMACTSGYRNPEPLRRADCLSKEAKRAFVLADGS